MKLIRCVLLSMLMVFLTTTVMSAPQDFSQSADEPTPAVINKDDQRRGGKRPDENYRGGKPSEHRRQHTIIIQWRTGTTVPKPNNYMQYEIDHTQYPKLPQPSRYQQWIKVDNHFILVNVVTNTILKVIPE